MIKVYLMIKNKTSFLTRNKYVLIIVQYQQIKNGRKIPIKAMCLNGTNSSHIKNLLITNVDKIFSLVFSCRFIIIFQIQLQMDQQLKQPSLPIHNHKQEILSLIEKSQTTIICGETGSGKTTQVPQYLFSCYDSILITQPRRISAITLAERVSEQMGYKIGEEIGYSVRFQQKRSQKTRVTFMTDGMAIRQLMIGKMFDIFIIDEAHERSINTDVLMALLKEKQKQMKNKKLIKNPENSSNILGKFKNKKKNFGDFKIVIMSATIQSNKFMDFFSTQSIIRIKGRTFPTQIYNLLDAVENYLEETFNTILQIHYNESAGDILVFLTGQDQILSLSKRLTKTISQFSISNLQILQLYSALPHEQQHAVFTPNTDGKRRVILATNIAETSITINGLRYVVDPGFMKIRMFDSLKNVQMLTVMPISKANALQRAGRAGRQTSGKCFRLYIKGDYDNLKQQITPQILRSQLTGPILQLKAIGVRKVAQLQFMDKPSKQILSSCLQTLTLLKCINEQQQITNYGFQISKIPLQPYLSHLLVQSYERKCQSIMLLVLSVLSIDNLFYFSKDNRNKNNSIVQILKKYAPIISAEILYSDHLSKANILKEYIKSVNKKDFCKGNFINKNNIKRAVMVHQQLQDYLKQIIYERSKKQFSIIQANTGKDEHNLKGLKKYSEQQVISWLKCMEECSVNYLAKLNKDGNYQIISSGQIANIHPQSLLFFKKNKPNLIAFYQVVKTSKLYLRDVTPLIGK